MDVTAKLREFKVIPVVTIKDVSKAVDLAKALVEGGLPSAEVTFRTAGAAEAIKAITKAYPDMFVGAGTVLTVEQADEAIDAGAKFIVAPGFNKEVVQHCFSKGVPMIPGVCTPTEIEAALSIGLTCLKFFPAEAAGGVKMIKALTAPYGMISIMPTGGISPDNISSYLACKSVVCCGGSWMTPNDLIDKGDFEGIKKLVSEAVALVKDL